MKVLVSVDIEGIVGIESRLDLIDEDKPAYSRACRLMTQETNAAIQACVEAGCKKIYVIDGHGSGKNLVRMDLDRRCTLIKRSPKLMMMTGIDKVDAVIFLGYHGMAGKPKSFCAHTNSGKLIKSLFIDGKEVSEGITNAMMAKHFNVKTLFVAGTDKGVNELKKEIPNVFSVVSLRSISKYKATSLPIKLNLKKIQNAIKKSIGNKNKIKMIALPTRNLKFVIELKKKFPKSTIFGLDIGENRKKITFSARNIVEGHAKYRKILATF